MRQVKLEKIVEVYSLDEMLADPEKKQKLIKANPPNMWAEESYMEWALSDMVSELESFGFIEVKAYYDLSCSQGSGASFTFENVDIMKLISKYPNTNLALDLDDAISEFRETLKYLIENHEDVTFYGTQNSYANHYTHSKTVDVRMTYTAEVDDSNQIGSIVNEIIQTKDFEQYMNSILEIVRKIYYDATDILYSSLSKEWDDIHSEKFIINELREEGYEFTEDGKVFAPDVQYTVTEIERTKQ